MIFYYYVLNLIQMTLYVLLTQAFLFSKNGCWKFRMAIVTAMHNFD